MKIPLFPLHTVLFPGGQLQLQVFEPRYLEMVQRCRRDATPFGVVCLSEGSEVQRRDGEGYASEAFSAIGTLARVVELDQPYPGLMRAGCAGGDRFRVLASERLGNGLWTAQVEPIAPDRQVPVPEELLGIAQLLQEVQGRLHEQQPDAVQSWPPAGEGRWREAGWIANRWAELLPLQSEAKQNLLALDSPLLRLELVGDALEQLGVAY